MIDNMRQMQQFRHYGEGSRLTPATNTKVLAFFFFWEVHDSTVRPQILMSDT